jgi:hypothetical protein
MRAGGASQVLGVGCDGNNLVNKSIVGAADRHSRVSDEFRKLNYWLIADGIRLSRIRC